MNHASEAIDAIEEIRSLSEGETDSCIDSIEKNWQTPAGQALTKEMRKRKAALEDSLQTLAKTLETENGRQ
mgnify:CR=1 FL=1